MQPDEAMSISTDDLLSERGSRYGKFADLSRVAQGLKEVVYTHLETVSKVDMEADQLEALDMIFNKIGRIVNGDPDYSDSWHDIAGYAKLVADRLDGVEW